LDRFNINLSSGDDLKRRVILLTLYLAMVIVAALIGFDLMRLNEMEESKAAFDARIDRVLSEQRELQEEIGKMGRRVSDDAMKAMQSEIQLINQLLRQKSFSWTAFLSDLEERVPAKLSVARIQPDFNTGQVLLGGAAPSLKEVTEFVGRLQQDPFEGAFLMQQEELDQDGKKEVNFSIRFKYNAKRGGV
jgi:Tfp pilus assembly protein PilN